MKNKTTLAAGVLLLLAGIIAAILASKSSPPEGAGDNPTGNSAAGSSGGPAVAGTAGNPAFSGNAPGRARTRGELPNQDLVDQYGESRTKLAAAVSDNVIAVLTDATEIGEKALAGMATGPFGSRNAMRMGLGRLSNDLKLTEEQQEKATAAYQAFQRRELERSKASIAKLKQNPSTLMRLMLASDASARGDMSDEEYQQLQASTGEELKGVLNPLDEKNFRGGKPLRDETFVDEFKTVLDPEQSQLFEEEMANQAAQPAPDPNAGNISNIPKMDLEKMDQTITSVRKMTIGFKSLIEGMGGLQDLRPPTEPQPEQQPEP
ncbi:MAG: hypothetical protein K9N23_02190 [Akkermansiaceae bacterium]|nr:hypothetical protein [Akkermansiaceae bacterium]MCF7730461.1 hypothetical protein [Akkermansiaceae bacterium]